MKLELNNRKSGYFIFLCFCDLLINFVDSLYKKYDSFRNISFKFGAQMQWQRVNSNKRSKSRYFSEICTPWRIYHLSTPWHIAIFCFWKGLKHMLDICFVWVIHGYICASWNNTTQPNPAYMHHIYKKTLIILRWRDLKLKCHLCWNTCV